MWDDTSLNGSFARVDDRVQHGMRISVICDWIENLSRKAFVLRNDLEGVAELFQLTVVVVIAGAG